MAKIIMVSELAEIVAGLLVAPNLVNGFDEENAHHRFVSDIAQTVCNHCGCDVGLIYPPMQPGEELAIGIRPNESMPADGGVFASYDRDASDEGSSDTTTVFIPISNEVAIAHRQMMVTILEGILKKARLAVREMQ